MVRVADKDRPTRIRVGTGPITIAKDFTFHLFNSDTTTTPQGGSYQVFNHQLKSGDIATVVGAFNLMDNPKYSITGGRNAYCTTGGTRSHDLWDTAGGRFVRVTLCTVEFDNAAAASKIKRGEQPTEEEMFKIKSKPTQRLHPDNID
jgi:hypothetical protein